MAITDQKPRKTYAVGATPQSEFAVPFAFFATSDIRVSIAGTVKALGTDYTVTGGNGLTYKVVLNTPVSNTTVSLVRRIPIDRSTDFPAAGAFKVPSLNRELDRNTAIVQQLADDVARSIRPPEDEDADGTLPPAAARAGRVLGFGSDGAIRTSTATMAAIEAAAAAAGAAGAVIADCPPVVSDGTLTSIDTGYQITSAAQVALTVGGIEQRNNYTVTGSVVGFPLVPVGVTAHVRILGISPDAPAGDVSYLPALPLAPAAAGGTSPNAAAVDHVHPLPSLGDLNVQPHSANLDALAALALAADLLVYATGSGALGTSTLTTFARSLLAAADAGAVRALLSAAPLASPALTGTPTTPTAAVGTNSGQIASTAFVQAAVAALVASAPGTLDTLNELAAALGNDANFATTVTNALAGKAPLASPAVFTNSIEIRNGASTNAFHVSNATGGKFLFLGWDEALNYGRVGVYASTNTWLNLVINEGGSLTAIGTTTMPTGSAKLNVAGGIQVNGNGVWHAGNLKESIVIALGDETTAITAGTAKVTIRMPYAFTLTDVRASLATAGSSATIVNIKEGGVSIFSTKLQIDSGAKTSVGSAAPRVISDAILADDAEITLDIDTAGTGAKGLKVALIGRQTP